MQIESGKFYRTRDGRRVGPMARAAWGTWSGWDSGPYLHEDDGTQSYGKNTFIPNRPELDLVAEWVDEPVAADAAATSLRDDFAIAVIASFRIRPHRLSVSPREIADTAYAIADAMCAAREGRS